MGAGRLSHLTGRGVEAPVAHGIAGETACRVSSPRRRQAVPEIRNLEESVDQALLRWRRNRIAPPTTTRRAAIPPKIMPFAPVCASDRSLAPVLVSPAALVSEEESFAP